MCLTLIRKGFMWFLLIKTFINLIINFSLKISYFLTHNKNKTDFFIFKNVQISCFYFSNFLTYMYMYGTYIHKKK